MKTESLLKLTNRNLEALFEDIEQQGGAIEPHQERELQSALNEHESALTDLASVIKETEARAELLRKWKQNVSTQIHRLESRAEKLRPYLTQAMAQHLERTGKKTVRSDDEAVRVTLTQTKAGRIRLVDPSLESQRTTRGWTEEDVQKSTVPLSMFSPKTLYTLDRKMVKQYLDEGHEVSGVELDMSPSIRIYLGGSGDGNG